MTQPVPCLTAIVLTLNEQRHLPGCLDSLRPLTERVIVFDSGSTDATREIAGAMGACVVVHSFAGYAAQRNEALARVETPWVLFVDADERLTGASVAEIRSFLTRVEPEVAAARFPRRNIFFGRELRGGGWWPDEQTRLLRHGRARYDSARQVHEVVDVEGDVVSLAEPVLHLNYDAWPEFFARQRAYTMMRAQEDIAAGRVPRRRAYLSMPARELWRRFVRLRGYRDGALGMALAGWMALEEVRACRLTRAGAGT